MSDVIVIVRFKCNKTLVIDREKSATRNIWTFVARGPLYLATGKGCGSPEGTVFKKLAQTRRVHSSLRYVSKITVYSSTPETLKYIIKKNAHYNKN